MYDLEPASKRVERFRKGALYSELVSAIDWLTGQDQFKDAERFLRFQLELVDELKISPVTCLWNLGVNLRKQHRVMEAVEVYCDVLGMFDHEDAKKFGLDVIESSAAMVLLDMKIQKIPPNQPPLSRLITLLERLGAGRFFDRGQRGRGFNFTTMDVTHFKDKCNQSKKYEHKDFVYGCAFCFLVDELKKCSNCLSVSYCSRQCQRKGWKKHKAVCRQQKVTRSTKFEAKLDEWNK